MNHLNNLLSYSSQQGEKEDYTGKSNLSSKKSHTKRKGDIQVKINGKPVPYSYQ